MATESIILEKVSDDIKHIFPNWTQTVAKEYTFKKKLGKGGFGQVWLCERNKDNKVLACKVIDKKAFSKSTLQTFHDEVTLMQTLKHPGIIEFVCGYETKKKLYIIMEPCSGGELYAKVISRGKLSEKDIVSITRQILEALEYCHSREVVHCDLKPENILFTDKTATKIKIIDFGLSKVRRKHEWISKVGGTPMYIAPECLTRHYTQKCDIWAVGVMVFEMLHGYLPFMAKSKDPRAPILLAKKGLNPPANKKGPNINTKYNLSPKAQDFITALIVVDPSKRPDAQECLLHPWLLDDNSNEEQLVHVLSSFKARQSMNGVQKFLKNMIHSDDIESWVIEDVKKVFKSADKNSDGMLEWEEFNDAIKSLANGLSEAERLQLFEMIDEDHSHNVDIDEFVRHFAFEHVVKHDEMLWNICKDLDVHGDKSISKEEMSSFIKKNPKVKMNAEIQDGIDGLFAKGPISYDEFICAIAP